MHACVIFITLCIILYIELTRTEYYHPVPKDLKSGK